MLTDALPERIMCENNTLTHTNSCQARMPGQAEAVVQPRLGLATACPGRD